MTDAQPLSTNIADLLAGILRSIEPRLQPLLLARLERLAAERYRRWSNDHSDQAAKEGLLACADREEEIARRIESLFPDASAIQDRLLSQHPDLLDLNRTLFEGRPLLVQFAIQAEGERAGSRAWNAYAASAPDPSTRELLQSCSSLEQANADFLESLG